MTTVAVDDGHLHMPPAEGGGGGEFVLPPANLAVDVPTFVWGLSLRFGLSCAFWLLMYAMVDVSTSLWRMYKLKETTAKEETSKCIKGVLRIRAWHRWRMWRSGFATELAISLLLRPGTYLVGRHSPRMLLDFIAPGPSVFLAQFDQFSPLPFFSFAINRLTPAHGAEADLSFILWHLPTLGIRITRYLQRRKRHGACDRHRCRVWASEIPDHFLLLLEGHEPLTCSTMGPIRFTCWSTLHFVLRTLSISFAVYLPMSEGDLLFILCITLLEKWIDAKLIRACYD